MRRARLLATHHRGVYAALRRPCLARDAVYSLMQMQMQQQQQQQQQPDAA